MVGAIDCMVTPLWLIGGAILIIVLILLVKQRKEDAEAPAHRPIPPRMADPVSDPVSEEFPVPATVEDDVGGTPNLLEYPFSKLESLSIAGSWETHLQCRATENRCQIEIDPAFARYVKVEHVRNGLLIRYTGKKRPESPMTIELTTTGVPAQVKTMGKSRLWIDSVETERFVCKATDGGKVEIPGARIGELVLKLTGNCRAECGGDFGSAELEVAGGSNSKLRGVAHQLYVRLSGASKAEVVLAEKAEIDVSGASKLKIEVSEKLEGDLSGGSSLKYRGELDTSGIRISGSSRLRNWD